MGLGEGEWWVRRPRILQALACLDLAERNQAAPRHPPPQTVRMYATDAGQPAGVLNHGAPALDVSAESERICYSVGLDGRVVRRVRRRGQRLLPAPQRGFLPKPGR